MLALLIHTVFLPKAFMDFVDMKMKKIFPSLDYFFPHQK